MGQILAVEAEGRPRVGEAVAAGGFRGARARPRTAPERQAPQHLPTPRRSAPLPLPGLRQFLLLAPTLVSPNLLGTHGPAADTRSTRCHGAAPALGCSRMLTSHLGPGCSPPTSHFSLPTLARAEANTDFPHGLPTAPCSPKCGICHPCRGRVGDRSPRLIGLHSRGVGHVPVSFSELAVCPGQPRRELGSIRSLFVCLRGGGVGGGGGVGFYFLF